MFVLFTLSPLVGLVLVRPSRDLADATERPSGWSGPLRAGSAASHAPLADSPAGQTCRSNVVLNCTATIAFAALHATFSACHLDENQ